MAAKMRIEKPVDIDVEFFDATPREAGDFLDWLGAADICEGSTIAIWHNGKKAGTVHIGVGGWQLVWEEEYVRAWRTEEDAFDYKIRLN